MARSVRPADYDVIADPYCYPGSTILINIPDIRDAAALAAFETVATAQRAEEPLPRGRLSIRHYRAVHHHLFQDVYAWAGRFRTVRLSKEQAGHPLALERLEPRRFLTAMIGSFHGDERPLVAEFCRLVEAD